MSYFSDAVRGFTGGLGVGESVGATIGGFFGGPSGAATGARIGGGVTEFIDLDRGSAGQATARDVGQGQPGETGMSGQQTTLNLQYPGSAAMGGANQAGFGLMVGPSIQAARQALGRVGPGGAAAGGGLIVAAADFITDFFGNTKKLVITRKMQREVKELYMYMNADLNAVAAAYSQYKGMNFSAAMIQKILLKRFRNDGPYVTKAAIRKTRSTVRKLERLEMLKKQITGTRAAPRRRAAATTRITQVK